MKMIDSIVPTNHEEMPFTIVYYNDGTHEVVEGYHYYKYSKIMEEQSQSKEGLQLTKNKVLQQLDNAVRQVWSLKCELSCLNAKMEDRLEEWITAEEQKITDEAIELIAQGV